MPLTEVGPRVYHKGTGVGTLSLTPQADRAAIIRKILITGVSATDTWVLTCAGQEVGRFYEATTGNQQLLGGTTANYPKDNDIYDFLNDQYGIDLIYPVPQGMTFTLASANAATANISFAYTEHNPAEVTANLINHPNSNHFLAPIYAYRNANVTATGEVSFDTQISLSFMPNIFINNVLPQGWAVDILGFFLEGVGVNTYSGAADHRSVTDHLSLDYNGQRMFTRDLSDGIPLVGASSATGSANTVSNSVLTPFPAFQLTDAYDWKSWDQPLRIRPGDNYVWKLGITGDVTGGASYAQAVLAAICDIREVNI